MFQPLSDLLKQSAEKHRFDSRLQAFEVLSCFETVIRKKCGNDIADNINPISFKGNTITVACLAAAYAQEITLYRHEILQELNAYFQSKRDNTIVIEKIAFLF